MRSNTPRVGATDAADWPTPEVKRMRRRATLALALFTTVLGAQLLVGAPLCAQLGPVLREAKQAAQHILDQSERLAASRR